MWWPHDFFPKLCVRSHSFRDVASKAQKLNKLPINEQVTGRESSPGLTWLLQNPGFLALGWPWALVRLQGLTWAYASLAPALRMGTEQRGLCIRWAPNEWHVESDMVVYLMPALWVSAQLGVEKSHPEHP